jgi:hypothetical protein
VDHYWNANWRLSCPLVRVCVGNACMSDLPVVYHRWFDSGEGWAFHPELAESLYGIMGAVEKRLTVREQGRVRAELNGKVLLGEITPDAQCEDPRARGRHPIIFRAVLADPVELERRSDEDVLSRLKHIQPPRAPGHDETLKIHFHESPKPVTPRPAEQRSLKRPAPRHDRSSDSLAAPPPLQTRRAYSNGPIPLPTKPVASWSLLGALLGIVLITIFVLCNALAFLVLGWPFAIYLAVMGIWILFAAVGPGVGWLVSLMNAVRSLFQRN